MNNTPTRVRRKQCKSDSVTSVGTSSTPSSNYVPVIDLPPESPLRVQGNLTGIPRKLKDLAADWHNAKIKWTKACQSGFVVCNQIGNQKMDSFVDGNLLPDSLLPLCDELSVVINNLKKMLDKMSGWTQAVNGIHELLQLQNKASDIIFQTWTIARFVKASEELLKMYQNEFTLKQNIYQNICHSQDKNELMFMLACWSHEPYVEETVMLNIDAMVLETGHTPMS